MLHINDLTYRIGGRVLLDSATVHIPSGHKAGIVGRNGTGKTTLFRLIFGDLAADDGSITLRRKARMAEVAQEAPNSSDSLLETVLAADTERAALLAESETADDPMRIADIHNRLADIDSHTAPARASAILSGLGFDSEAQARPCTDFSGGWRMRVALASTLFSRPDMLLLDEPTNHLDLEATIWLESYLASWQGTLLIISHDRNLLNTAVDEIIHLHSGKLTRYTGNYDRFERTRREQLTIQSKMQARQIEERRRIQSFVDRFRAKASKAKQAQSRVKMLARMEPIASVIEERTTSFNFPTPDPMSPPLISLDGVDVGYEAGNPVLRDLNLRIDMDDRIALLGANGNGKSTLVKLLADRLKPMAGKSVKSSKLRVGYFAQHQSDELDLSGTPLSHMTEKMEMAQESKVRAHLGRFGFESNKAITTVGNLSGGEKARLLFALMTRDAPHVMLLDEPTNHLDVDAREALVHALNNYDGAVILVSHDPHLIELVSDRFLLVTDGGCKSYDGDLDDYRRLLLDQRKQERQGRRDAANASNGNGAGLSKKEQRKARAQARAETSGLRKSAVDAEKKVDRLTRECELLEARMANPEVYEGSTAEVMKLQVEMGKVKSKLAKAEEIWIAVQEKLEDAESPDSKDSAAE